MGEQTLGNGEGQGKPGMLQSMRSQRAGHDLDFPGGSDGKAAAYNAGDPGLIPGQGTGTARIKQPLQLC